MRYLLLSVLAPLLFGTSLAVYIEYAGGVLARDGHATAKIRPFQGNPLSNTVGGGIAKREPTVIKGLLQIRQSCSSGFGLCSNNECCPLGGDCCTDGCCGSGKFCYSTGCCKRSETGCEQVTCCPSGTHCCRGGGCCESSEYCVEGGCCPLGEICSGGGGAPPPPPPPPPPPHTTTKAPPPPTHTTTEAPPPPHTTTSHTAAATSSSKSASSPSNTQPASARPSANSGEVSVGYEVDDSRIVYTSAWTDTTSSCTSKARRTTVAMESFTLIVASASRIYLNIDIVSVEYDIFVNNVIVPPSSQSSTGTQSCSYVPLALSESITTTNINVTVVVVGQLKGGGRKRQSSDSDNWSFQLNEILTFNSGGTSQTDSTAGPSATAGQQPANSAAIFTVTWFQVIVVALLVAFGSFR